MGELGIEQIEEGKVESAAGLSAGFIIQLTLASLDIPGEEVIKALGDTVVENVASLIVDKLQTVGNFPTPQELCEEIGVC